MKRIIVSLLMGISVWGTVSAQQNDPVLMTIDDEQVTKSEFEQIFWKNKKEKTATKDELDEYIELFKKFKLKVKAAEDAGLDTSAKFKNELAGYKAQLERPYLVDTTLNEALIEEAYYRTQNEVRASHILIKLPKEATPKDTLEAYNKIMKIKKDIENGKITFAEAAVKFSEDPSAKQNKGDLGYFTAFRMVYPFENAAYNTKVGEISEPFRTQFGYHIVRTEDLRKGRGKVKVAHIMVRVKEDLPEVEKENLKKKAEEIFQKLQEGADFAELAREYSDDRNSARKGGEIGWINTGETFKEFDDAAFGLKENNQISKPVKTPVGWHIIKRLDYKPVGSLEEMRSELKHKIQRDVRSQQTRVKFINNLKKEYGFVENRALLFDIYNKKDINPNEELFSFAGKSYKVGEFIEFLSRGRNKSMSFDEINKIYEQYAANKLIAYEKTQLEKKYPEFKALLKEYRDGILLFDITDKMVWSKAVKDTAGLELYYDANKGKYMWPDRVEGKIFSSNNKKIIKKAYKLAKKGKIANDSIVNYLNQSSQLNVKLESGTFEKEKHPYLKNQSWKKGVNKPVLIGEKYVFVIVDKELPKQPKKLSEAKGMITADYQDYLEKEWLKELEKKHKIVVNEEVLYSIIK